jgi:flagellar biosynthesis chaperone FliJ
VRLSSALESYEHTIVALEEVNADYELAVACAGCARLQEQLGQLEEARANLEKAKKLFVATGTSGNQMRREDDREADRSMAKIVPSR